MRFGDQIRAIYFQFDELDLNANKQPEPSLHSEFLTQAVEWKFLFTSKKSPQVIFFLNSRLALQCFQIIFHGGCKIARFFRLD